MLRSGLCDYSYAYIVVKERATVEKSVKTKLLKIKQEMKKLVFKNNAPFRSCIS